MSASAPIRRSARAAARDALIRIRATSSGPSSPEQPSTDGPTAKQPVKRRRAAKKQQQEEPEQGLAAEVAVEVAATGTEAAAEEAKPKRGPKKKTGAAAAAAAGPSREFEQELWAQGYANVAGVDEAGRGPLAGPVVAAACIIPAHVQISGIDDSKKLNAEQREHVYADLTTHPDVRWATQVVDAGEIDDINILQAALKAMECAAAGLGEGAADFVLVDGNRLPKAFDPEKSRTIVKGDSKCYVIAAASIIAKVTRDRLMDDYAQQYPQYNFGQHKGYGVPAHVEAIRQHGPCPIHRRTFAPVKNWYPRE